jgi:hypothetical protein
MAEVNFTADFEDTEQSFDVIPAGEYIAIIEESDYKLNKKGSGMILNLKYSVIDGPMKGRKLFENLNLKHENAQAQHISQQAFNSVCKALGFTHVQDSSQLHDKPLKIEVGVSKNKETDELQNKIKKHVSLNDDTFIAPQNNGKAESPSVDGKKKAPWEK